MRNRHGIVRCTPRGMLRMESQRGAFLLEKQPSHNMWYR
jgi:hypothetical protein